MKTSRFIALLLALLLAAGLAAPAAAAEDAGVVSVSDAQGLLAAIAPGAVIELEPGCYNLTEAIESAPSSFDKGQRWLSFVDCWEGKEVVVEGVDGLTLRGLGDVEIVVEPRAADVLRFENCSGLTLENLTLGHTTAPGVCTGDVLEFLSCSGITLSSVDLYGCGTYGVVATNSSDLRMERSVIRECSYGALWITSCVGFRFVDCEVRDCGGYNLLSVSGSALSFDGCAFEGNSGLWGFFSEMEGNSLRFYACRFGPWESAQLVPYQEWDSAVSFDELCVFSDETAGDIVEVSSAEEFFEAIHPGAVVCVRPGRYDLGAWIAETWAAQGESWNAHHPYVRLQECYEGVEAVISGADGLTILGLGNRADTELIVEARYANVLAFELCTELALANLTLGHTEGGPCAGSVIYLDNVGDATLTNLDLYGCGSYAVYAFNSGSLNVRGCTLRDCSGGPASCYNGWGEIRFEDCIFTGSAGGFDFIESPEAWFLRCVFDAQEYASVASRWGVTLVDCWH